MAATIITTAPPHLYATTPINTTTPPPSHPAVPSPQHDQRTSVTSSPRTTTTSSSPPSTSSAPQRVRTVLLTTNRGVFVWQLAPTGCVWFSVTTKRLVPLCFVIFDL
nr:hypothetical protein [Tanacetum cinerariifolium]